MKYAKMLLCALLALMLTVSALPALAQGTIWKTGDRGEEISRMQARLKELGYLDREPTGQFDADYHHAVWPSTGKPPLSLSSGATACWLPAWPTKGPGRRSLTPTPPGP